MATINYRKNYISTIATNDGIIHSTHDQKVTVIWQSYKDRLGSSINPTMLFNLSKIIQPHCLKHFEEPFTLKQLPPDDRAPRPDGFNGKFLKNMLAHYQAGLLRNDMGFL